MAKVWQETLEALRKEFMGLFTSMLRAADSLAQDSPSRPLSSNENIESEDGKSTTSGSKTLALPYHHNLAALQQHSEGIDKLLEKLTDLPIITTQDLETIIKEELPNHIQVLRDRLDHRQKFLTDMEVTYREVIYRRLQLEAECNALLEASNNS